MKACVSVVAIKVFWEFLTPYTLIISETEDKGQKNETGNETFISNKNIYLTRKYAEEQLFANVFKPAA